MKNDFDFIKDKIDNSGVNAPADMDADFVLNVIGDKTPQPVLVKPKRTRRIVTAVAAAFVAVAALSVGLGIYSHLHKAPSDELLRQFKSRDEITRAIKELDSRDQGGLDYGFRKDADMIVEDAEIAQADGATGSSSAKTGGASHSETYKQVEGVDEADIIKTDGRYIYCVESGNKDRDIVKIFSAQGKDSEVVAELIPVDMHKATDDEAAQWDYSDYLSIEEMYLRDSRLTVILSGLADLQTVTRAYVYDVSDIEDIRPLGVSMQDGFYCSSRMIGDTLYLVTDSSVYSGEKLPCVGCGNSVDEIPYDCVYAVSQPEDSTMLTVGAFDLSNGVSMIESKAILGCADTVYCNENNLYITAYDSGYTYTDGRVFDFWEPDDSAYDPHTQIIKAELCDGVRFTASTKVAGYVDSQYSLDEYNGCLRVATTSYSGGHDVNNLFVLDSSLNQVGSVTGFAEGESIKAVRYVGDTAYVITYEQTDPLFVIDTSDPTSPKIMGEVKITGFSSMLVPVDENTILGIGYNTEEYDYTDLEVQDGLKLALFDVSDPTQPKVLDTRVYADYYSEVMSNPKALVYNPDRDDYVIPLNYHRYDFENWDEEGGYEYVERGGMLNFAVRGGKIVEIDRYQADFEEDVERCVYVGDTVYMTHYNEYPEIKLDSVDYK